MALDKEGYSIARQNVDIDNVLNDLDDKITEIGFDKEYRLNKVGLKLQLLYDALYTQNSKDE